ncbi:MAG: hypothetical protein GY870_19965 [archaeon]|nr:hypothetical protein [archaeon]
MPEKEDKVLINLQIDKETLDEWDKYCKEHDLKRSQFIRMCVHEFLNKKPLEELIEELIFRNTKAAGRSIEKRIIIEFDQIKRFLKENSDKID